MSFFRLRRGKPAEPSSIGNASSILRGICLAAVIAVLLVLPAWATDIVTTTITGTVYSGTDSTEYFGVGTNLATQNYTLIFKFTDQAGTDITCSGGAVYTSEISGVAEGEADLVINNRILPLASAPISSAVGQETRVTKVTSCSSNNYIYPLLEVTYDTTGSSFSGSGTFGDNDIYPSVVPYLTGPEWDDTLSPSQSTAAHRCNRWISICR